MNDKTNSEIREIPVLETQDGDSTNSAILRFYDLLGWDRKTPIDPRKIRVSPEIADEILANMRGLIPDNTPDYDAQQEAIATLYVDRGPGCDEDLTGRQIRLIEGWIQTE